MFISASYFLTVDCLLWGLFVSFISLILSGPLIRATRGLGLCTFSTNFTCELRGAILILLTLINLWSCLLAQATINIPGQQGLQILLLALAFTTIIFFVEGSWLKFYVYFELSLIPIFLIIIGWGYQMERVKASKAIVLYTVTASLPLLLIFLSVNLEGGDMSFQLARSIGLGRG